MPSALSVDGLGQRSLDFLQSNILRCVSSCEHGLPDAKAFLPTRLIDVRQDQLRVVETRHDPDLKLQQNNTAGDTRYTTLSYCWGSREEGLSQLRLTKDTQAQLQSGFHLETMSAVQKDAVAVARALGIPYLWIDALCILQGDAADWERESSLMHKIYGNAYVTICNLKSRSCQQGFLPDRAAPDDDQLRVRADIPFDTVTATAGGQSGGESAECYEIGPGSVSGCSARGFERDTWSRLDFDSTQWISRAWTFQEATLSARMILFARSGLYFSCSGGLVWEYGRVLEEPINFSVHGILRGTSSRAPADDTTPHRSWNQKIATQFSGRQATYLADSLPALSGTAQVFAAALPPDDEYVAGLWKGDLMAGLFWKMEGSLASSLAGLLRSFDDGPYVGPSWSWVGRPAGGNAVGKVRSFGPGRCNLYPARRRSSEVLLRTQCDALETQTVPSGADKYGKISAAALFITTRVYPLALGWHHLPDDDDDDEGEGGGGRLSDSGNSYLERPGGGSKAAFSYHLDFFPNPDVKDPDQSWKHDLTLVLLGSINYGGSESEEESGEMPCGLIVHRAKGDGGPYRRVGTFGPSTSQVSSESWAVSDLEMDFCCKWESRSLKVV